jgi:uncharacterized repeat protein (TIGR03803 family)
LIEDSSGAFYGTLSTGGAHDDGAVFKLTPSGTTYKEKVLYSFAGGNDGNNPRGPLVVDKNGALFGTTFLGGGSANCAGGCGTVFKLAPGAHGYSESVIHKFAGGNDGSGPVAGLYLDPNGALFGTTYAGGGSAACQFGCGIDYRLDLKNGKYVEAIVNSFVSGTDGASPAGGLVPGKNGILFGTTVYGGSTMCGGTGCGTVYELTPIGSSYEESVVYAFQGGDGQSPENAPLVGSNGALYGTTLNGGNGYGTWFKLMPSGSKYILSNLYTFQGNGGDGASPWGGVVSLRGGVLYGVTLSGGPANTGAVFEMRPVGSMYSEHVHYFFKGGADGNAAYGTLLVGKDGNLYGTTQNGGTKGEGNVFEIAP